MNVSLQLSEAYRFLHENRLMTIATLCPETQSPQAALVYYFVDTDNDIIFATTTNSRKLRNVAANSLVAILIARETNPIVMQIEGTAQIIENLDIKLHALERISKIANQNAQSYSLPPIMKLSLDSNWAFVRVRIEHYKYSNFSESEHSIIVGTGDLLRTAGAGQ